MTQTNEGVGTITVFEHVSGMVVIKNSFTGKTFSLYPEEAEYLHKELQNILYPPQSSNPPEDQL